MTTAEKQKLYRLKGQLKAPQRRRAIARHYDRQKQAYVYTYQTQLAGWYRRNF